LDVDTNPDNPIIGNRSLSRDPEVVARLGSALVRGIQSAGVAACAKHFPGHGDTSQDSHRELPRLPHALERLESVELLPFRAAFDAGIASIMTAHVIFEPLDAAYPATMSRAVLSGLLREKMQYRGLVFTDDVEMKAIADHYGYEEAVTVGALAGVDNFLVCHTSEVAHRMVDTIIHGVESGRIPQVAVSQATRRVNAFSAKYAAPALDEADLSALRSSEHLALAEEIGRRVNPALLIPGTDPTEVMEQIRVERQRQS
jgi:beta-N-acetylhexosaminidase